MKEPVLDGGSDRQGYKPDSPSVFVRYAAAWFACLIALSAGASETTIDVGGRSINIPTPDGFTVVGAEQGSAFEVMDAYLSQQNERFLRLVPDDTARAAEESGTAVLLRFAYVEVAKNLVRYELSADDFEKVREQIVGPEAVDYDESLEEAEGFGSGDKKAGDLMDKTIETELDGTRSYRAHFNSKDAVANSMSMTTNTTMDGETYTTETVMTTTLARVNGRLLFLYVYGEATDLEWSRQVSKGWTESIIAANNMDTSGKDQLSEESRGINWLLVLISGVIGGAIGLVFQSIRRKKERI